MYAIIFHAHQKLDRVAHRHLLRLLPKGSFFPGVPQIVHFEGHKGPDNAKLKRQEKGDQPWHFINPLDIQDTDLHRQINNHYTGLVQALKRCDAVRSSFEAAWLAHALVDGLTPAHHFPYEAELERLRGGETRDTRKGLIGRIYVKSDTTLLSVQQSLKLVGPKGLLTNHAMFEAGAYAIIAPLRLSKAKPTAAELKRVLRNGVVSEFQRIAKEVAWFKIYDRFIERGWVQSVSRDVRRELAPRMVRMITLAWYAASYEASQPKA